MSLKFYIASGYENKENVANLGEILRRCGFNQTFDWTDMPDPIEPGMLSRIELDGVTDSDVLIAMLPGNYGTHTEIGAALSHNKPVVIVSDPLLLLAEPICPFYHDRNVTHIEAQGAASVGRLIELLAVMQFDKEAEYAKRN